MEKPRLLSQQVYMNKPSKLPLLELAGGERVLIENHSGILMCSSEEIEVKVSYGYLKISGNNMMFAEMSKEQLVIHGKIESIDVHRR